MSFELSGGTIVEEGWRCAKCDREFSHATLGADTPIPRGVRVGEAWWCSTCASNRERPWMTALEMQFATLGSLKSPFASQLGEARAKSMLVDASYIPRAETYAWSTDSTNAVALASRTVPNDAVLSHEMLPGLVCFWWFGAGGIPIDALDKNAARAFNSTAKYPFPPIVAALLRPENAHGDSRLGVRLFLPVDGELATRAGGPIGAWLSASFRFGTSVQDFATRSNSDTHGFFVAFKRFLIAGCTWLQQRVIVTGHGHVERHRRKQIAREYGATVSGVKVIQLRRSESPNHASGGMAPEQVEWSCRWIVNGHWRNQPYKTGHRLKYILPYVKGPDDKPLKVPTHTVYAVNR